MTIKGFMKWSGRGSFVAIVAACLTTTAFAVSNNQSKPQKGPKPPESVPGQYVIQLSKARASFDIKKLEARLGGRIVSDVREDIVLVQRDIKEDPSEGTRSLSRLREVLIAEPNYILRASATPDDKDYGRLWGLNNIGQKDSGGSVGIPGIDMSMERAWSITTGSRDVLVGVIDTGINYRHPDLVNNMWVNEAEASGVTGVDDDGNGYVDDIHGYNFVANTGDPMDDNGHGTHCAGTIGAEGNNGIGVVGVAWKVSLMGIKFLDANGSGTLNNAIKALDYATKSKAVILSNSWGGNIRSELLQQAVERTYQAGQLFIAAAGNDSSDNDTGNSVPAGYTFDNIVSVAAIDNRGNMAYFSNYGAKTVHVAAPGVAVYSTSKGSSYESLSGTSMATPHVSGLAALLMAQNPSWTYKDAKTRIVSTARPLASLRGRTISGGAVDAYYALTGMTPPADPNDPAGWSTKVPYALSSDHPYTANMKVEYTINVPGAKRLAVHFEKFETESGYDKVEFLNAKGESLGSMSGRRSGQFGPIVTGDTVTLKFTTDGSVHHYGFDIDFVAVEK